MTRGATHNTASPSSHVAGGGGARKGRFAALHALGDAWRLVIIEINGATTIVSASSYRAGDAASVREALSGAGVTRLVRVLPASAVVCRTIGLPDGPEAELVAALELIAEAEQPGGAPRHRRGAGLIDVPADPGKRAAMLLGWSGPADPPIGGIEESYTAEPAALETLLRGRSAGVAVYADRARGSIAIVSKGPRGGIVRGLREDGADPASWRRILEERIGQAARAAAYENGALALDPGDAALLISIGGEAQRGIAGAPMDPAWWNDYGVALGAALGAARTAVAAGGAGLFGMTAEPRRERAPLIPRLAAWLGDSKRFWKIAAAGLALALLVPLGSAWLRQSVLASKAGGLEEQRAADRAAAIETSFYQELEKRRWPMTKLLADLAGALPLGIRIESVRLELGQRATVRGTADSLELVNQLQAKLNDSGVFAEASIDRTQAAEEGSGIEFDASARVVRPHAPAKGLEDYAKLTLAQRLYGEDAAPGDASAAERAVGDVPRRTSRRAAPAREGIDAPAGEPSGESRAARSRGEKKPLDVPAPITDEEIAKLDANTAMKEWTNRQKAAKQQGIDEPTRERLKSEAEKCKARMAEARKEAKP